MKLFEFAPTRSIRVRWTLQELGVEFESVIVNMIAGEHRQPEFLRINPAGKLPVLVDGDLVLTESVAIVLYLAEKYLDKGLVPTDLRRKLNLTGGSCSRRPNPQPAAVAHRAAHFAISGRPAPASRRGTGPRGFRTDGTRAGRAHEPPPVCGR